MIELVNGCERPRKTEAARVAPDGLGCSFHAWWMRLLARYATTGSASILSSKVRLGTGGPGNHLGIPDR